jgi:hypothetical protein
MLVERQPDTGFEVKDEVHNLRLGGRCFGLEPVLCP